MGKTIAICLLVLPLLHAPSAHGQDSINPDAAGDEGDGTQIVVPPRKPASTTPVTPTDLHPAATAPPAVQIDADACRYVTQHVPSPDTDYAPDVDVNGNPVTPADAAPRPQLKFPTTMPIPITSKLGRILSSGGTGYRADALVGVVSLANGQLSFNGQPIGDDPDVELAALCRKAAHKENSGAR